jgi:hypothetical protein
MIFKIPNNFHISEITIDVVTTSELASHYRWEITKKHTTTVDIRKTNEHRSGFCPDPTREIRPIRPDLNLIRPEPDPTLCICHWLLMVMRQKYSFQSSNFQDGSCTCMTQWQRHYLDNKIVVTRSLLKPAGYNPYPCIRVRYPRYPYPCPGIDG